MAVLKTNSRYVYGSIRFFISFEFSLPFTMALHLLRGMWWIIVCPPSGVLCDVQKGCVSGAVSTFLPDLTYPQRNTRLQVVRLVPQGPRVPTDTVAIAQVIT